MLNILNLTVIRKQRHRRRCRKRTKTADKNEQQRFKKVLYHPFLTFLYYIKNWIAIKAKNPPIKKNGANGIYFSCFFQFQIYTNTHVIIMAIDKPWVPSQIPPAPSNLMSPIPIGGYSAFFLSRSNIKPTISPRQYPIAPPITESALVTGHGKNVVVSNPAKRNGNK